MVHQCCRHIKKRELEEEVNEPPPPTKQDTKGFLLLEYEEHRMQCIYFTVLLEVMQMIGVLPFYNPFPSRQKRKSRKKRVEDLSSIIGKIVYRF